jgi:hypothetical protein
VKTYAGAYPEVSPYADTEPPQAAWPTCVDCGIDIEAGFALCLPCVDERRCAARADALDDDRDDIAAEQLADDEMAEIEAEDAAAEIIGIL